MKGGKQPIILMLSLVAVPWLCLASSAALLPALASETVVDAATASAAALKAEYIKVSFSTASATPDKYKSFIAAVRAGLVSTAGGNNSSGIPVLVSEDDDAALETFLNVTLTNKAGRSVSLKMDVSGACLVGYEAGNYSCLLKRSPSSGCVISSVTCYQNVEPWGGIPTVAVDEPKVAAWRVQDLDAAVSSLFLFPNGGGKTTKEELSRAIAACDVMLAVAATYPYVERRMSAGMSDGNGAANDGSLQVLRDRWSGLSAAVQGSFQGAFAAPQYVKRSNGEWLPVDNVRRAVPLVSFIKNDSGCSKKVTAVDADQRRRLPLLIRSVVDDDVQMMMQLGGGAGAGADKAVASCGQAEPTVRLVGPYGRCVDVPYGWYTSGTQVQLWSCKSNSDVNQLWTLKRDGTIRSNGKCLAAAGDKAGARVVIDDCPPPRASGVRRAVWEVRVDGTIALKGSPSTSSGLVLAVTSSSLFAGLTVRADDRGTGQSWTPTNATAPLDAAIVGFRDRCLQVDSAGAVTVAAGACGGKGAVQWSIYPDGSIRPPAWLFLQRQCLATDASGRVWVKYCEWAGSACERWVFRNDGTILNTGTGRVLQVDDDTPSKGVGAAARRGGGGGGGGLQVEVVAVSPATANGIGSPAPNQKWVLML